MGIVSSLIVVILIAIITVYLVLDNWPFQSPLFLFIFGLTVCLGAAYMYSTIDMLKVIPSEKDVIKWDLAQNILSFTLAVIGASIISTAISQRIRIIHNTEIQRLMKSRKRNKIKINRLTKSIEILRKNNNQKAEAIAWEQLDKFEEQLEVELKRIKKLKLHL